MKRNMNIIGNLRLFDLCLPGSHDSGSFNLTDDLIDVPEFLAEIVKVADILGLDVGDIIDGWAKTQTVDFFTQLSLGIRYLDIRAFYDAPSNTWKLHHGPVAGNPISILFDELKQFVSLHPEEVLVIEVAVDDPGTAANQLVFQQLVQNSIGSKLWPVTKGFQTINSMVSSGQTIIMTIDIPILNNIVWPRSTIYNTYANSPDLPTMEQFNINTVKLWDQRRKDNQQLFKISWTLTANSTTILEMVFPDSPHNLIELADIANSDFENWYNSNMKGYAYPVLGNILIIDDLTNSAIFTLSQKGSSIVI
uniref:Phosphatidylinositol-specific phospholipase C X domain-containing protein n=1 Tax=Arcella intermedia TaxID=1963864 RepID=A0A6B2LB76_9EUKA